MLELTEKRIIFDKCFIEGSSIDKLKEYEKKPFNALITKGLQIECIGNLTKSTKSYEKKLEKRRQTKEQHVAGLFRKIVKFPIAMYDYMDLIKQELFFDKTIKIKHDFFGYGVKMVDSSLDIFEHQDLKEDITRWKDQNFTSEDYRFSDEYHKGLLNKKAELEVSFNTYSIENIIDDSKKRQPSFHLINYLEDLIQRLSLENTDEGRNYIIEKMKKQTLSEFAPYTAYVFTIDYLFHRFFMPKWKSTNNAKIERDWVDFNYIYYFPFVDFFLSKDKIFVNFKKELNVYFAEKIQIGDGSSSLNLKEVC